MLQPEITQVIDISQPTVAKYMVRPRRPSSQTWKTFLKNRMQDLASTDFFVVPTATFRLLFVFLVLSHNRRRVVHFAVTSHPTAEWTAQQLLHAFPWDTAPRYLLRDHDSCYGEQFHSTTGSMDIHEVLAAPRSPWQNAYVERLIGSIRRECLDHVLIFNAKFLEFAMDARSTPAWIRQAYPSYQVTNLAGYARSAVAYPALPAPIQSESLTIPGGDGFRLYDLCERTPALPQA